MTKTVPADPIMLVGMTDCLAIAVENAVFAWKDTLEGFFGKFLHSGLADSFAAQEPFVTTGCTGEELVAMVNEKISGVPQAVRCKAPVPSYSNYYWIGYAIALYIAESGKSFSEIFSRIPPKEWLSLYPLYHEYGEELLLEKIRERISSKLTKNTGQGG